MSISRTLQYVTKRLRSPLHILCSGNHVSKLVPGTLPTVPPGHSSVTALRIRNLFGVKHLAVLVVGLVKRNTLVSVVALLEILRVP